MTERRRTTPAPGACSATRTSTCSRSCRRPSRGPAGLQPPQREVGAAAARRTGRSSSIPATTCSASATTCFPRRPTAWASRATSHLAEPRVSFPMAVYVWEDEMLEVLPGLGEAEIRAGQGDRLPHAQHQQILRRRLRGAMQSACTIVATRRQAGQGRGRRSADRNGPVPQRRSWKRTLRARKSSETRRNASRMSVPSSSAGRSASPNTPNGGTSAKAIGTLLEGDRAEPKVADRAELKVDGLAGHPGRRDRPDLVAVVADQLVAKGEVADRDLRPGVDHRVERQAGGLDLGQDQLAVLTAAR